MSETFCNTSVYAKSLGVKPAQNLKLLQPGQEAQDTLFASVSLSFIIYKLGLIMGLSS